MDGECKDSFGECDAQTSCGGTVVDCGEWFGMSKESEARDGARDGGDENVWRVL